MILAILQARTSSTRLPGKVLAPVAGRPMILRQIERLQRSEMIDTLVVATSLDSSDDELTAVLSAEGVQVRRGSLDDVAGRFASVVEEFQPSTIVRLTADCPLADHEVIDRVIHEHLMFGTDYTSNTLTRTYPQGLDVECVTEAAFSAMMALPLTGAEREHVTMALYSRPEQFTLHSVEQDRDLSQLRWTVDLPVDLEFVRLVYQALYEGQPDFLQDEILEFVERNPDVSRVNE